MINLYFEEEVKTLPSFRSKPYLNGSENQMKIAENISIFSNHEGHLYTFWDKRVPIPDELKGVVKEISSHETIPQMAHRESGIYRHKSAECELTPADHGNSKREKPVYQLMFKAKDLGDILELEHLIKTGEIRPEESYEGQQNGISRIHLETKIEQMQQDLRLFFNDIDGLKTELNGLYHSLVGWWPFCRKKTVRDEIKKILNHRG